MRISLPVASVLLAGVLAGCGSQSGTPSVAPVDATTNATASTASPATPSPATPSITTIPKVRAYRILTQEALEAALLEANQLPQGYSQTPPTPDAPAAYFCGYTPPAVEQLRVHRDFTKGTGPSAEAVRISLRQFASADDAGLAWGALAQALKTCTNDVINGGKVTYTPLPGPKVGEAALGVRTETGGTTVAQYFVLVGQVIMSTGGDGLVNADADTIGGILKAQVDRYVDAAGP